MIIYLGDIGVHRRDIFGAEYKVTSVLKTIQRTPSLLDHERGNEEIFVFEGVKEKINEFGNHRPSLEVWSQELQWRISFLNIG